MINFITTMRKLFCFKWTWCQYCCYSMIVKNSVGVISGDISFRFKYNSGTLCNVILARIPIYFYYHNWMGTYSRIWQFDQQLSIVRGIMIDFIVREYHYNFSRSILCIYTVKNIIFIRVMFAKRRVDTAISGNIPSFYAVYTYSVTYHKHGRRWYVQSREIKQTGRTHSWFSSLTYKFQFSLE